MPHGRRSLAGFGAVVIVGLICGVLNTVYALSYVSLAFPGPLSGGLGLAVGMGLLSAALVSIVVALVWRFPGSMGVISPEATLVIGTVGLDFVVAVAPDRQLPTLMATVALVALALGVLLLVLARARLGYLIHYLPFPVVAGLIGGLGILLVIGGLKLAVPDLLAGGYRLAAVPPGELLATTAVGTLCWLVQHRWPATFNLPLLVTAATLAFWLAPGAAERSDWLLQGFDATTTTVLGDVWRNPTGVDWVAIGSASPTLAMLVAFLAVVVLADGATMEAVLGRHLEPNGTLRAFGIANLASGSIGGFPSVMNLSGTSLAHRCRSSCRMVGVVAGTVPLTIYWLGPHSLGIVPAFVVGGIVVYVGLEFVAEWLVLLWRRLGTPDRAILVAVVASVSLAGFAEGFVLGLLLGIVFFVVRSSTLPVIRHETTGRYRFSHVDRPEARSGSAQERGRRHAGPGARRLSVLRLGLARPGTRPPADGRRSPRCAPYSSTSAASPASTARAGTISTRSLISASRIVSVSCSASCHPRSSGRYASRASSMPVTRTSGSSQTWTVASSSWRRRR